MTAPELSAAERAYLDRPEAPESIRERLAAEFAAEDAVPMLNPPTWENVKEQAPWRAEYYRRLADRALAIMTESALR